MRLIAQDVSESVQSALSSPEGIIQRLTPPSRLNDMILHACKMCKVFIGKMKSVFSPRPRKQRTTSEESDTEPEPSDADDRLPGTHSSDVVIAIKDIIFIIRTKLNDITEPLLDVVPDTEYTLVQSQSSREIEDVAVDITRSIAEDAAGLTPSKQKSKQFKNSIGSRIKRLLVKCFANTTGTLKFTAGSQRSLLRRRLTIC
ncbi:uncharacterized protein LOC119478163 [Sebastes umbrosus]|uniref:uncharacterized protein LOC119478163 n=1 Tax=Sebastes umbrosus TaxID=72105 RepID=UPI00189ED627|nr:uncharacterized protein LOC119478163 [Sebastes umbrosus]